ELHERKQVALVGKCYGGHALTRRRVDQALAQYPAVVGAFAIDAHDAVDQRILRVDVKVDEALHRTDSEIELGLYRPEGAPMNWRGSEGPQRLEVVGRPVS